MRVYRSRATLALALAAAGCSPALDWRDARPEGSGVTLLLPCRPNAQVRAVLLAGRQVRLALHACSAGGATWALAFADVGDPGQVTAALDELRSSVAANLGAAAAPSVALAVPGATPNPSSTRSTLSGHLPDGSPVQARVAVFARGTFVFQATVLGAKVPADAAETFFASLRVPS
jgi:hypothetical protein